MATSKPCFDFQKGHCRRGEKCRYSHATTATTPSLRNAKNQQTRDETETESLSRQWTYMIPLPGNNASRFVSPADTKKFFQMGWNLIDSEDAGTHQHVITKLGGETGLAIIKSLTEIIESCQKNETIISVFQERTLPFFRIISHPDVLSSLILETPLDAIYTFLFGPSGRRGLNVFRFTATALSEMILERSLNAEGISTTAISSSLAVMSRLIEINQSAQVVEGFTAIVETISACMTEDLASPSAQHSLTRIKRRLNIGSSLPVASVQSNSRNLAPAIFEHFQDFPGHLSKNGARHDNDHASITDIQILPTTQEITSLRQEYLPLLDSSQTHLSGLAALLDRQFRLLREDTVGQLRDAVHEEVIRLERPNHNIPATNRGQQGVRKLVHDNVCFSMMSMDRRKGLQVVAEFDQPKPLDSKSIRQRKDWWEASKLLQIDSLVCFISSTGKIIFLSVCNPIPFRGKNANSDEKRVSDDLIPSLSRDAHRASVLLSLAEYNVADAIWIANHIGSPRVRQSLVEFPGVLLPSFKPTLKALQGISKERDLPFSDIIAPEVDAAPVIKPPAYATRRGFSFNLNTLAGVPLSLTPGQSFDFAKLSRGSTLDEAQQFAVVQALSTGLALIQGPPGTGKSFTGVSIIKALLENRKASNLGPIICICYTNHALDQLLEHLVKDGVNKIIRLGSRSKSKILENLTLQNVRKSFPPTKTEKHDKWFFNKAIDKSIKEIEALIAWLNKSTSSANIQAHLMKTHGQHYNELFENGIDEDGYEEARKRNYDAVENWLRGAPKKLTSRRHTDNLSNVSLKEMSAWERRALLTEWTKQRKSQLTDNLIHELAAYHTSKHTLENCYSELDLRCLREAHIIGATTSGLARNIDLLRRVGSKVVMCEEAGEVLEAHTLTAFLRGVEHVILIGDHEQLRPQINNYELQHDNPQGKKYSLDVSLFERLVKPRIGDPLLPLSTLKTQRRMHPTISELVRVPLYPDLEDHPTVSEYPEVDGMKNRLYWLDHRENEDQHSSQDVSLSKTNTFEVDMVASLVSHLVRQGTYGPEDIAIITPYLGQLQKLKKRLANSFEIIVGDRDQEELETKGLEDDLEPSDRVLVQKTTLLNALRIATVDNFQGEEAKVIVVSLVRSNTQRACGFLKTSNRINVLLSRARHGMYIVGNSDTARPVPMWGQVLSILERSGNIGPSLALCCPRHRDTPIEVSTPDDFVRKAPEGGCAARCVKRLYCGHACPNLCHAESLHNAVRCLERCPRTKKGCEHPCHKPCGDPCDKKCQVELFNIPLPCGHISKRLKCWEAQNISEVRCIAEVEQVMKHCNHNIRLRCHQLPLDINHSCSAICGAALTCGHNCTQLCRNCNTRVDGIIAETTHARCNAQCKRPYSTCNHNCKAACHGDKPCPLCTEPCDVSCNHSKCSKLCHEPCAPCSEDCPWSCPHRGSCLLPCAAPCNLLPCSDRCEKRLACGHQCISICGETCPGIEYCQICARPEIKEIVVDFIMSSTFEEVDLDESPCIVPTCGHILSLESMDGHMSMSDFYTLDSEGTIVGLKNSAEPFSASGMKSCPTCRGPLRNINRYGRIVRRALIDESTKKFIVWANNGFVPLEASLQAIENELRDIAEGGRNIPASAVSTEAIRLRGTRDQQILQIERLDRKENRYRKVFILRRQINKFLHQVGEREQPFGRIYDLVQDASRHRGIPGMDADLESNVDILQVRSRLLTMVLLIRCDHTILITFLNDQKRKSKVDPKNIQIDLRINRSDCEGLIAESVSRKQPGNAVEGHLYWARFVVLEKGFAEPEEDFKELVTEAKRHLELAYELCERFPGQTAGMRKEIEDVEKMLRDSTFYMPVSNEEKAAIYAAMSREFSGTGHWYYCSEGHPFTIGECGMPMETSRCPQCGSPIGGSHHRAVDGVVAATDLESQFGRLGV